MINNRANAPNTAALCGSQRDGNANKLSVHLPPFLSSFPQRPNYRNGNVSWPRQRPSGCALLLQYYPLFPVRVRPPDRPTERVLYLAEMRPRKLGSLQRLRRARSRPFPPPSLLCDRPPQLRTCSPPLSAAAATASVTDFLSVRYLVEAISNEIVSTDTAAAERDIERSTDGWGSGNGGTFVDYECQKAGGIRARQLRQQPM